MAIITNGRMNIINVMFDRNEGLPHRRDAHLFIDYAPLHEETQLDRQEQKWKLVMSQGKYKTSGTGRTSVDDNKWIEILLQFAILQYKYSSDSFPIQLCGV